MVWLLAVSTGLIVANRRRWNLAFPAHGPSCIRGLVHQYQCREGRPQGRRHNQAGGLRGQPGGGADRPHQPERKK